ncbi:MAG: L,D-transpeptidase [Acidobacteria bacterium]|nr:L,D-transpeptidase [Acidobacteriota bacterium]
MPLTSTTGYTPARTSMFAARFLSYALIACALTLAGCQRQGHAEGRVNTAATAPAAPAATPDREQESVRAAEDAANRRPMKLPLVNPQIVVEKGARRLRLFAGGEEVRTYRVVLGFAPEGDKEKQGDGRTPEGTFYVCVKNDKSAFYLSLGLSYPNEEDAARGLRDGLITRRQSETIARAIKRRGRPPWDTALGGEIFIHGGGTNNDWTSGCVALENEQIKELFDVVPLGTIVRIEP